jgi:glycosyltransferase involved in cell wall biosynthesis
MKILILTSPDPYKTAGVVALDLYQGLCAKNEVKVLVNAWGEYPDKNILPLNSRFFYTKSRIFRKVRNLRARINKVLSAKKKINSDYSVQDYDQSITYFSSKKILKRVEFVPDVILVLFMQKFLSFKNLKEINQITKAPVFLYLMDMAPFTGGCHYAWQCTAYEEQCGNCPAIYSNKPLDRSYLNWKFKKEMIEETDISIIAGAEWTYQQLVKSTIFKEKPKHKILLPIKANIFAPVGKTNARKILGLPLDKKIIFFGAVTVKNNRKGFNELIEALLVLDRNLPEVEKNKIHLAIAGNGSTEFIENFPFAFTMLSYLNHSELPKAYQAVDVFVSPSIEDSGPMMINQSIMSGTPVVAFEMGVALDLVITGQTGYRAKLKDSADLAKGIKYILNMEEKEYGEMSQNCRNLGLKLCHPQQQTDKFIRIFKTHLNQSE